MRRPRTHRLLPWLLVLTLGPATTSSAQTQSRWGRVKGDGLGLEEWTRDVPEPDGTTSDNSRWRVQLRPRYEVSFGHFDFGVGAEINYSEHRNDRAPDGGSLTIIRDNYRARDLRLDLAYGRARLGPVTVEGGRMVMPIPLTELVWDRDLRPQGGALSLRLGSGAPWQLGAVGLYAQGSHVFEDQSVIYGGGAGLSLRTGERSTFQLLGSYLQFEKPDKLDPVLARQNTYLGGYVHDYRVVDVVARLTTGGPLALVADYCRNTARSSDNAGLWLGLTMGEVATTVAQVDYTYLRIDADATVGAFNTDDYFWSTAVEAHRIEIGRATAKNNSVHAIAEWARPTSGSSRRWLERWRIEWRSSY